MTVCQCVETCLSGATRCVLDYIGAAAWSRRSWRRSSRGWRPCRLCGAALLGGETAELPGFYAEGEYDLVGFAVGVVERDLVIDGSQVAAGDALIGLPSSGLHSNGYSLARFVLLDDPVIPLDQHIPELGRTLGAELLEPTRIYAGALAKLFAAAAAGELPLPHALAHITGGGIAGNSPAHPRRSHRRGIMNSSRDRLFDLIQSLGASRRRRCSYLQSRLGNGLAVAPRRSGTVSAGEQGEQPPGGRGALGGGGGVELV